MSIFKTKGFDSIIGKGMVVSGDVVLNGICVVDGHVSGNSIKTGQNSETKARNVLIVNGTVSVKEVITADDLTITGVVIACTVRVEGTLAIKAGCILKASCIHYRTLVAEPGAVIFGEMRHLDHSSQPLEV
jgi:cytoskeletal protein CcmA (bactofilin family)